MMEDRCSDRLISLEKELVTELELVLAQEEVFWLQKSRKEWMQLGDRN